MTNDQQFRLFEINLGVFLSSVQNGTGNQEIHFLQSILHWKNWQEPGLYNIATDVNTNENYFIEYIKRPR